MKPRRILFWIHLSAGVVAGIVIFIMSVTGVLLAYEHQILRWGNREFRVENTGQPPRSITDVLAEFKSTPTAVTLRSDAGAAVEISLGRDRIVFVNPYTGDLLGESRRLPAFFSQVENIHRWLGVSDANRPTGRAVTGACNFAFFVLVLSGPFIWWPKDWGWTNLKKIVIFRRGLGGRALYWNWHNVLGTWCVIPLLIIVMSGVVMSYPWANNILYRLTGNEPPAPPQATAAQQKPRGEGKPHNDAVVEPSSPSPLEKVLRAAEQVPQWQSITIRMPSGRGGLSATADQGNGRPDLRTQFIFDSKTGDVRQETFSSYNSGRRLRTWARFSHTGEAGGFLGETIAAIAAAGASLLVFTGITLSIKRLISRRARA